MSERTRALLSWHLDRVRPCRLTEADSHQTPRALFVDADHPDARAELHANRVGEGLPVVLLALDRLRHPIQRPVVDVLAKPVSASALDRVVERLSRGEPLDEPQQQTQDVLEAFASPEIDIGPDAESAMDEALEALLADPDHPAPLIQSTVDSRDLPDEDPAVLSRKRARADALFGREEAIDAARAAGVSLELAASRDALYYDPEAYLGARLVRELARAQRQADATLAETSSETLLEHGPSAGFTLSMAPIELYVLPGIDRIYTSSTLRSAKTARLTFSKIEPNGVTVMHYQGPTMPALLERVRARAVSGYTIDGFIWLSALMSSRGRLASGSDSQQRYRLRTWPNLTRLEPVPTGIEIAGCWARRPASIDEVIERTGVHPRFVHAFAAAASAVGCLTPQPEAAMADVEDDAHA